MREKYADRTMAAIARRYTEHREAVLEGIRSGRVSASMSGIEYCDKPWEELSMDNHSDMLMISTALTWDGQRHDCDALRQRTPRELELHAEKTALYFKPHEQRKDRLAEIDAELARIRLQL